MGDKTPRDLSRRDLIKTAGGAAGAMAVVAGLPEGEAKASQSDSNFAIDVACQGTTFTFDGPTHPDDSPDYGATFIVEGVIYPHGTFDEMGASSGLLEDGHPEFPDRVVGKWTCYGMFVGDGGHTEAGHPEVVTTQIYDFDPDSTGEDILISRGFELAGLDAPFTRALTGGTGLNRSFRGEVVQRAIALNATDFPNIRFRFQ